MTDFPAPKSLGLVEANIKRRLDNIVSRVPPDKKLKEYVAERLRELGGGPELDFLRYCMHDHPRVLDKLIYEYPIFVSGNQRTPLVERLRKLYLFERLDLEIESGARG